MNFHRHRQKIKDWREWVRRHGPVLAEHGLPPDTVRTELDWFLFLDHGYIQSTKLSLADWWTISLLSPNHARWLADFIQKRYPNQYPELVVALRREVL